MRNGDVSDHSHVSIPHVYFFVLDQMANNGQDS